MNRLAPILYVSTSSNPLAAPYSGREVPIPVAHLPAFPAANWPCPALGGQSRLLARARRPFPAAGSPRPSAIAPSADFQGSGRVARLDAGFALAMQSPCGTPPRRHRAALPIQRSIPDCSPLSHRAGRESAPSRMLCALPRCAISCNTRVPENTRLPYSSARPPRPSPAT